MNVTKPKIIFLLILPLLLCSCTSYTEKSSTQSINSFSITPTADHRGEEQTYLTFPEWYIVYSSDEYAQYIHNNLPSGFPYFSSVGQFWGSYFDVYRLTKNKYPFNFGYHAMVIVIGTSITVEYTLEGIYENTIGRITEMLRTNGPTAEDTFAAQTEAEYVNFIRVYPWYDFTYSQKLKQLWTEVKFSRFDIIRQVERKAVLSLGYGFKALYSSLIKLATKMSYDEPSPLTVTLVDNVPQAIFNEDTKIQLIKQVDPRTQLISLPRYDAFKDQAVLLSNNGVRFYEIAGNTGDIMLTVIAKQSWQYNLAEGKVLFTQKILTRPEFKRVAIHVSVSSLNSVLQALSDQNIEIEHIYDY